MSGNADLLGSYTPDVLKSWPTVGSVFLNHNLKMKFQISLIFFTDTEDQN